MRVQNPNIDLRIKTTRLTSAQILALKTTAFTLVPAPGAGRIIAVIGIALIYNFVTRAYQSASGSLHFTYGDAALVPVTNNPPGALIVGTTSGFFYDSGVMPSFAAILPGADNSAIIIPSGFDLNAGPIVTTTLGAGGAGYAANDTGTLTNGNADATYKVLTVDGGGAVLTYQITAAGTGYIVENGSPTAVGGAQPGVGVGLTLNITAVSTGDGTLKVVTYHQIIPVP